MTTEKEAAFREELAGLLKKNSDAKGVVNYGYLHTPDGKRILEIVRVELRLMWPETTKLLQKSKGSLEKAFSEHGIRKEKDPHIGWSPERVTLVKECYGKSSAIRTRDEAAKLRDEMVREVNSLPGKKVGINALRCMARDYDWGVWGRNSNKNTAPNKNEEHAEPSKEELLANLSLEIREWDNPLVLESNEASRKKPGIRIGFISGIGYPSPGYSAGLVEAAFRRFAEEGTVYNCLVGHLTDWKELMAQVSSEVTRHPIAGIRKNEIRERIRTHAISESARALSALIPKIRLPKGEWETDEQGKRKPVFVRLYISTSPNGQYDGVEGEDVAHELHKIRSDVRLYDPAFDRVEVQGMPLEIGILSPSKKARLPGRYVSTKPETLIEERKAVLLEDWPQFWVVGAHAGAVYTPSGLHTEPYVIIPALRRLLETRLSSAENQVGVTILDIKSPDEVVVYFWSYGDLLKDERKLITAPRGSSAVQKQIVNILNKSAGSTRPFGRIAAILEKEGVTRAHAEEEIKGLVEENPTTQKSWPGLSYDEPSGRYGFHQQWIQERMRYSDPRSLVEDRALFFGCLHAGYTTTDYKHFVTVYPRVILENGVTHLFALGDLTAGLHHGFHESGEVFGSMNYSDQERFASELVATVMFRVFEKRFEEAFKSRGGKKMTAAEVAALVDKCLINLVFIPGNHDLWQEQDGHTPLDIFYMNLLSILVKHLGALLFAPPFSVPQFDVYVLVKKHISRHNDFEAEYTLPSGIKVAMQHPHMGGAQTTTLRAQKALGLFGAQIAAIANFHTATVVHQWRPDLGQCVALQAGTQVIYTRFERRKMKSSVDFGPIFLSVSSNNKRIFRTACAYFNKPLLLKEIPKFTDPHALKREIGLLT